MRPTASTSATCERLTESYLTLEKIDRDRRIEQDPSLEKATERKIIHRELLELELQEIDDQLEQICSGLGLNTTNRTPK